MSKQYLSKGFTLLELLIAISIFSVMAAMAYGGVRLVIDGNRQIEQAADGLSSLQRVFLFIQQDIEQAVPRGIRDEFGSNEEAFICCTENKLLYFTRGGIRGDIIGGANLYRVEYSLSEGRLERKIWSVLDRVQDSKATILRVMDEVQEIDIRILGLEDSEWQNSMPSELESDNDKFPRAVNVTITTEKFGVVSRIFILGS